jgi:hypothetical protein
MTETEREIPEFGEVNGKVSSETCRHPQKCISMRARCTMGDGKIECVDHPMDHPMIQDETEQVVKVLEFRAEENELRGSIS